MSGGAHLSISLERLQAISSQSITRVGLSATVGNLKQAAQFISALTGVVQCLLIQQVAAMTLMSGL